MTKACEVCGESFEAKRPSARYCGATCRQRAKRGASLTVVPEPPSDATAPLVEATRATLETAGVLGTVSGQASLILAARIAAGRDTGAAIASMTKQLEASVAAALASVSRADQMDEVTQRRDAKLRAAGRA